jgi:hypothetical protein
VWAIEQLDGPGSHRSVLHPLLRERTKRQESGTRPAGPLAQKGDREIGERGVGRVLVGDREAVARREGLGAAARRGEGARRRAGPEGERADDGAIFLWTSSPVSAVAATAHVPGRPGKGRREIHSRARTISASSAPAVLRSGRCRPTSNGSVAGTSALPFQANCCPVAMAEMSTSSSLRIEALPRSGAVPIQR